MKKTLKQVLMLVVFMTAPMTMSAQVKGVQTSYGRLGYTPRAFTYNGDIGICNHNYTENNETVVSVYNEDFEVIKTFTISEKEILAVTECLDFDNDSYPNSYFSFSQTLFNKDDKYEYIAPIYEEDNFHVIGFRIMSEDGTELQNIYLETNDKHPYFDGDNCSILMIKGKIYLKFLLKGGGNGNYINPVYLVDPQTTEVKEVKNMPASFTGNYSLDGRRQARMQRGVNILHESDGTTKKVLVK